jgi:hypothetical protein
MPWREQVESAKTFKHLHELRDRMHTFRVLDPTFGSGYFLSIAYREMKRLEARIYECIDTELPKHAREGEGQMRLSFLTAQNFHGMDINPFAVEIAKITMRIPRNLAIDELHITEQALPLDNLDTNFRALEVLMRTGRRAVPTSAPRGRAPMSSSAIRPSSARICSSPSSAQAM